ncbi:hypothetical protein [Reyranella sp.]|uniref:bestrophin-like domain n=1 Tax=Reyranella sp. TaxID=1929291 RepID=UPI003BA8687E
MVALLTWDIVLSLVAPTLVALLLFSLEARGPLAASIQASTGLVAPYFTCVAVLFGLFAALLASDVWQKDTIARQLVQAEGDAVQAIAHLAEANDVQAAVVPKLRAYAEKASNENPYSTTIEAARSETGDAYQALLASVTHAYGLDGPNRSALLGAVERLLQAHNRRLHVANDATAPIKWLSVLVLGALTQIALMLVHVSNRRAMRIGVGLFTVAFTFCLLIVAVFDDPFQVLMSDEPRATLMGVLDGL